MMQNSQYSLSEFILYLKLNIWTSGIVESLGLIQKVDVNTDHSTNKGFFVKHTNKDYSKHTNIHLDRKLASGLDIIDFYPIGRLTAHEQDEYNYLIVVSECRLKGAFKEELIYLKVTNNIAFEEFKGLIYKQSKL